MTRAWSAALVLCAVIGVGACNAMFGVDELLPGSAPANSVATGGSSTTASSSHAESSVANGNGGAAGGPMIGGSGGVPTVGCSDGTSELFDLIQHSDIVGCSGAWSVAGLHTPDSMVPQCNRQAGNSGIISDGVGCSVEDLCSAGWHVCATSAEVAARSSTGLCPPNYLISGLWVARQGQAEGSQQCTAAGVNNVVGCGTLGDAAHDNCAPLERRLDFATCDTTITWECGAVVTQEGIFVTKTDSGEGGVLCCRD